MRLVIIVVVLSAVCSPPAPTDLASPSGRLLGTTYFTWYRWPDEHFHRPDAPGGDAQRHHFPDPKSVSYLSADWHEKEIRDMRAAGIDFFLPVFWGVPDHRDKPDVAFSYRMIPPLVEALDRVAADGKPYPKVGLFYDTSTLLHGVRGEEGTGGLDLTTHRGREIFAATVRSFFEALPERHWAFLDGKVIVVLYSSAFAAAYDQETIDNLRDGFSQALGHGIHLIKERSWREIEADSVYAWGAALYGPYLLDTAALGAGYDDSRWPGRHTPVREREEGLFYRWSQERVLASPSRLVLIETWNEMHEGTAICETAEFGRRYIALTRAFADRLHAHTPGAGDKEFGGPADLSRPAIPPPRFPRPRPADGRSPGWMLRGAPEARFAAGPPWSHGIRPCGVEQAPVAYRETPAGPRLVAARPDDAGTYRLSFQVADAFLGAPRDDLELRLAFDDAAVGTLEIRVGGCPPETVHLQGRGKRREWSKLIKCPSLTRQLDDGADIELRATVPVAIERLTLHELARRPRLTAGVTLPLVQADPEDRASLLQQAREVGIARVRIPVSWAAAAPTPDRLDVTPIVAAVEDAAVAGFRVLVSIGDVPAWARPTWVHSGAREPGDTAKALDEAGNLAHLAGELALRLGPLVEAYEILPAPNTAEGLPPAPLIEGYLQALRGAAAAIHRVHPSALVVSGAVLGRQIDFVDLLVGGDRGLHFDVLGLAPVLGEVTPGRSGLTEYLSAARATLVRYGLGTMPIWLIDAGFPTGTPWLERPEGRGLLGRVARAGLMVARERGEKVARRALVVEDPEIPSPGGLPGEVMARELTGAGFEVRPIEPAALIAERPDPSAWPLLVLPFGEAYEEKVLDASLAFMRRGGTVMPAAGVPFGFRVVRSADGPPALATAPEQRSRLFDDLWIAAQRAAWRSGDPSPMALTPAPLATEWFKGDLPAAPLRGMLRRRPGMPRVVTGRHTYIPLLDAASRRDRQAAALCLYHGRKMGRLILVTIDPGFGLVSEKEQAWRVEELVEKARVGGVETVVWRTLRDGDPDGGDGLLHSDGSAKEAGAALRRAMRR